MEANAIAELQNLPEAELVERIASLGKEDLAALREAETVAGDAARPAVLEAIDKAFAAVGDAGAEPVPPGSNSPAPAAQAKAKAPAWQAADYSGPLTIDQMAWRRANIKPVEATTKPVRAKTK